MKRKYEYLNDEAFLELVNKQKIKEQFAKITLLDWEENPIQDIQGIGLVDYVYNKEIFGKGYSEQEQFDLLKQQMKDLGFTLEYEYGIDKLRTLYFKELKFSTNQIGLYQYQKK